GDNERMKGQHELLVGAALAGWALAMRRKGRVRCPVRQIVAAPNGPLLCSALCISYTAAFAYHAVQSQLCWGGASTNPWYAAVTMPWFLLLVTCGAFLWPLGRFRFVLPLAIALFHLRVEASTVLGSMTALYTAQATWTTALARLAFLQPAMFGTP